MGAALSTRRLVLHVGLSKSGTTALQGVLAESRAELAAHGLAVPLGTRPAVERALLRPLGWQPGSGFVGPRATDPLARLRRRLRAVTRPHAVISGEDLAELDEPRARSVVALARSEGFQVEVVVTARAWTSQLPSEYQQFLKHRLTDTFPDFLHAVRDGEGFYARHFRLRQDLADVCARWSAGLPTDHLHLVVLPRRGGDRDFIFREFADILGVPGSVLPPDHLSWVGAESTRQVQAVAQQGFCVHGDLDWLLADARDTGCAPLVRDEDVSRVAIETLARFAVRTGRSDGPRTRGGASTRRSFSFARRAVRSRLRGVAGRATARRPQG